MKRKRKYNLKTLRLVSGNASLTYGMRAILRFENLNGVEFDSSNLSHVNRLRNNGEDEKFFRRMKRIIKRNNNIDT